MDKEAEEGNQQDPSTENTEEQADIQSKQAKKNVKRTFGFFIGSMRDFLVAILDIRHESDPEKTRKAIVHDIEFRGANVWSLIASIFIASIGLNMNSTAVVIGAMLISPLMGPIIGTGYSIAINDLALLIKSVKNFAVMVFLAIVTSTFYFWLSPLTAASAELIGRTQPTLLDLFVAIFGGIAGIVSISKSERTNVIPGVAIATALIPPLCTAGYGLAEANWTFFFGASYLFLINSVFIALASFVVIRYLRFPLKQFVDPKVEKKVRRQLAIFGIIVMIPSAYMFIGAIEKFNFESQSSAFIEEVCITPDSKILKTEFIFEEDTTNYIDLYLIGDIIDTLTINEWKGRMGDYRLKDTELRVYQDRDIAQQYIAMDDLEQSVKTGIIEEMYQKNQQVLQSKDEQISFLENEIAKYKSNSLPMIQLDQEIKSIEPLIKKVSIGDNYFRNDSNRVDTLTSVLITWDSSLRKSYTRKRNLGKKIGNYIKVRLEKDTVLVLNAN